MAFDPVKKTFSFWASVILSSITWLWSRLSAIRKMCSSAMPSLSLNEVAVIDIDGGGIRSLNYDPVLKTYVIANEVKDENGQKFSQLWTWSGNPTDEPQKNLSA